jgi:phosphatidylinositol alpha-1,6-mannosyltransferase
LKKILFITHKYPPAIGGEEKHAFELAQGIKKSKELDLKMIVWRNRITLPYFILWGAYRRAKKILKKENIDLIYLNDGLMAYNGKALKKITSACLTCTCYGLDIVHSSRFWQRRIPSKMKVMDKIIAISRATKEECLKRGIPEDKIEVIACGVDTKMKETEKNPDFLAGIENQIGIPLTDKKILLSVGRPIRRKGFSWFMENVMPRLDKDVIYLIAGSSLKKESFLRLLLKLFPKDWGEKVALFCGIGLDSPRQIKLLEREDLKNRVFILGKVSHKDLAQLYKHTDLFIMPNIPVPGDMEGFGLTALEASANGTVVAASNLEGISDAIREKKNGFLIQPCCPDAWVKKINELLDDPEYLKLSAFYFQRYTLENCGWGRMTDKYINLFTNLS